MPPWICPTASFERAVMAILNVTPDSFSDGGQHADADASVRAGLALVEAGADLIDVGGESTRPGAPEVPADEEIRRVVPVIAALSRQTRVPLSVDTRKSAVARAALDAGATIINDVSGGADPEMFPLAAARDCGFVLMHMRGTPQTMQQLADYTDVVREVREHLDQRLHAAVGAGLRPERVILDPGIGFAKQPGHNHELLRQLDALTPLGRPLLVGVSRKSFLGLLTGAPVDQRSAATVAAETLAWHRGAAVVRTHDPRAARQALAVVRACAPSPL